MLQLASSIIRILSHAIEIITNKAGRRLNAAPALHYGITNIIGMPGGFKERLNLGYILC